MRIILCAATQEGERQMDAVEDIDCQVDLYRRWRSPLMAFFRRRVDNQSEAEDLTQEVFVRIFRSSDGTVPADVYVFQIAANLLTDRSRRLRVRNRFRDQMLLDLDRDIEPIDPHRIAASRERMRAFTSAVSELPDRTRTIFILYKLENMSQETIGRTYGISASAVKQHVAKAMAVMISKMRDAS